MTHKLLGIAGALRKGSTNRKLIREAARLYGDADFTEADIDLPLYNGDDEEAHGIPPKAQKLIDQISAADAILISTPEYNKSIAGSLKNAIDWASRPKPDAMIGKPVAIMSAANGATGGIRAQFALRLTLVAFQPRLLTAPEVMIPQSNKAFGEDGKLISEDSVKFLRKLMENLRAEVEAR